MSGHRIRTLVTSHGSDIFSFNGVITRRIKKFILNNCEQLTVVSDSMKSAVTRMNVTCRIETLPMGTDLTKVFIPDKKKQKSNQIIFVGRLIPQKGVGYLLDAFKQVVNKYPDTSLIIIGDGPEYNNLKEQAKGLGINKRVNFRGGIPNTSVATYLQSSSIAVFPYCRPGKTGEEGFGLVVIEALGCNCSVIASNQSAIMEIIKNKQTGLLINERDPEQIGDAIIYLLNNPKQRIKLAENGRSEVLKRFNWSQVSKSYEILINKCLFNK